MEFQDLSEEQGSISDSQRLMSEIMWDDLEYKRDWRQIATHDSENVKGFFGEYRYLSNFHPAPCEFEGLHYPSTENAYQAAKVPRNCREQFLTCSAKRSKTLWKEFPSAYAAARWDKAKNTIMATVVFEKFLKNLDLRAKLLETGDKYLEETNWWKDNWFGIDSSVPGGKNYLGKILMATRSYFQRFNV